MIASRSTENFYSERTTPGIQFQSDFLQAGGFVQFDWRDNPGGPRSGRQLHRAIFDLLRPPPRQLLLQSRRSGGAAVRPVLQPAPRHRAARTRRGRLAARPQRRPLLPAADSRRLRRPPRLPSLPLLRQRRRGPQRRVSVGGLQRPRHGALLRRRPGLRRLAQDQLPPVLKKDGGFGFRFNVRNNVFMRIDTAFSDEGLQLWVKFNNVF